MGETRQSRGGHITIPDGVTGEASRRRWHLNRHLWINKRREEEMGTSNWAVQHMLRPWGGNEPGVSEKQFTRAAGKWRVRVMATGEHAQEVARGQITPASCLSWWGWAYSEFTGRFWTSKTWSVLIAASLFPLIYVTQAYLLKELWKP